MHYPTRPVDKDKAEHELVINIKKARPCTYIVLVDMLEYVLLVRGIFDEKAPARDECRVASIAGYRAALEPKVGVDRDG